MAQRLAQRRRLASDPELRLAGLILLTEAETALGQVIAGKRMSSAELDKLLAD